SRRDRSEAEALDADWRAWHPRHHDQPNHHTHDSSGWGEAPLELGVGGHPLPTAKHRRRTPADGLTAAGNPALTALCITTSEACPVDTDVAADVGVVTE
ncbi:MAG: hypothetical protein AB1679_36630, partial [Actinomycetota bacterium]